MRHHRTLAAGVVAAVFAATAAFLFSGLLTSEAVQNPRISLDMVTSGNAYDDTTNTMTLGPTDNCLTSATANPNTHTHPTHLVIQDVEDLVGFQARLNYVGDKLRPSSFNPTPFVDNNTGQSVGFVNIPIDQTSSIHRSVIPATAIPTAPADGTNTPQTALVGATYGGTQTFPVSPDTPAKAVPDDSSYDAPTGGVLGSLVLQVVGNESGQPSLFMNLDDNSPNPPGSSVVVFNGTGTTTINLTPSQLGDGYHGEGATCVPLDCVTQECPASPTPTPPPASPPSPGACPSGTATPPAPSTGHSFCNDRPFAVRGIFVQFDRSVTVSVPSNPPGCDNPAINGPDERGYWQVDFGFTCIDPGEFVSINNNPAAMLRCWHWMDASGAPIGTLCNPTPASITPTPSPTATATATPTASPTPVGRTFVVNTTTEAPDANPGDGLCRTSGNTCSLQAAIQEANAVGGRDTINFSIGSGPQRINQTGIGNVYTLHDSVIIDGSTQPGFSGTPLIEIDGIGGAGGGLRIQGASNSTIREVAIVNSGFFGIYSSGPNNTFEDNLIGQRVDGTAAGNVEGGFFILESNSTIRDNVIANNGTAGNNGDGIRITGGTGHRMERNNVFNNAGLGIDLDPDGVTPNDPGDGDTGANNLQNFPFINSAVLNDIIPQTMSIQGNLNSTPNTPFELEFFHDENRPCNPAIVEGGVFIGTTSVTTDGSGNASFSVQFTLGAGNHGAGSVSATATDPGGNTSEFSACAPVGFSPATPTPTSVFTPTPTPTPTSPFTPTPTATATRTATATASPGFPTIIVTFTNNTGVAATDLHVEVSGASNIGAMHTNAPGCPTPAQYMRSVTPGMAGPYDFVWPSACVDPGESVTLRFVSDCMGCPLPVVQGHCWTHFGAGCSPPGTAPFATFVNNTGLPVNDLHFGVQNAGLSTQPLIGSPAACADPSVSVSGVSGNIRVDVVWPSACVDPGESASTALFQSSCTFTVCQTPSIFCFNWTLNGSNLGGGPACPPPATPTATATASPTATPVSVAGHDARLTKIGGVPKNVRLSPGEVIADSASVVVANESNHSETIGVYVDVVAPAGCTPSGRVLQTTVTLNAGAKTTLSVPVSYSCSDVNAANGQSYSWTAVADHGADDLASCPPGSLQGLACFNALADDDEDSADNRKARTGPKVVAQ